MSPPKKKKSAKLAKPSKAVAKKSTKKKAARPAKLKSKVKGPVTVDVSGQTLDDVVAAVQSALQPYATDVFADADNNTVQIILKKTQGG